MNHSLIGLLLATTILFPVGGMPLARAQTLPEAVTKEAVTKEAVTKEAAANGAAANGVAADTELPDPDTDAESPELLERLAEGDRLLSQAREQFRQDQFDAALTLLRQAAWEFEAGGDPNKVATALIQQGQVYTEIEEDEQAAVAYREAGLQATDCRLSIESYYGLAGAWRRLGADSAARDAVRRADRLRCQCQSDVSDFDDCPAFHTR
ncbi:MAG: hypothetical protein AB4042_07815 [Leptolyngbyaceae cyanobacterium]